MTDLVTLAEDGRDSEAPVEFRTDDRATGSPYIRSFTTFGALAEFHNACSPDVVLRMLDRLAALERVAEAARAFTTDDYEWDGEAFGDPGPALRAALAALDERLEAAK